MITIKGQFFDGLTSNASSAEFCLDEGSQVTLRTINDAGDIREQHLTSREFKVSSRLGNTARYIDILDTGRFETTENDSTDQLVNIIRSGGKTSFTHKLESNLGSIIIAIIVTVLVVTLVGRWGIPALSKTIVEHLPEKTSDVLEQKLLNNMESQWFKDSELSRQRQDQLQDLFKEVTNQLSNELKNDKTYTLKIRKATEKIGANAFALPSGTIILSDQLIDLVDNDLQIAGVLAHEFGHLDSQHSLRQVIQGSMLTFIVAWVAGDISGASSVLITAPALLAQLRYSREFESEADQYALRYIGCDSDKLTQMGRFFELLEEHAHGAKSEETQNDEDSTSAETDPKTDLVANKTSQDNNHIDLDFLSTHPDSSERSQVFYRYYQQHCR